MWGVSQWVTPANKEATVHPSHACHKDAVCCRTLHMQILFQRVKNLHFRENLNGNVQRISLTIVAFNKELRIENKFLLHLKSMNVGLIDFSKLPLGVSVCYEQMTCPGYIPASRLATPEIDTVKLMRNKSETGGMDGQATSRRTSFSAVCMCFGYSVITNCSIYR